MSCRNASCSGCRCTQPLAQMDLGFCLHVADEEESVWDTASEDSESSEYEEEQSEAEEPSIFSQLAAEIRQDQNAALEEGAQRLLAMDFSDTESEAWVDVGSVQKEPEPEKEPLFEAPIPLGECPICYEDLKMIDFTITKCGHTFHSSCVFKAMEQNLGCPMCRCQLLEIQEEEEYGDDQEEEEGDDEEDQEGDEESDGENEPKVTLEQLYTKLQNMGYGPLDILAYAVEQANLKRQDEVRNTPEFVDELGDKIWDVVFGNITLAHVDQRTYAQVAAKTPEQQIQPQPQQAAVSV